MHVAVMLREVIDFLGVGAGGTYVDGTLGGGGHAKAILEAMGTSGVLIGIDRDSEAVDRAREILKRYNDRIHLAVGNYTEMSNIAKRSGYAKVNGILLDIGISSWQLDDPERGFSFQKDGPLDMRMDRSCRTNAEDIINSSSEDELTRIFAEYGEEKKSRLIARRIVEERGKGKIKSTLMLAGIIEKSVKRDGRIHPATRVFQALRIAVNGELDCLEKGLSEGLRLLDAKGRFAVITFHSLEDRIVKKFFAKHIGRMESLQQGGARHIVEQPAVVPITKKPITPSEDEIAANPRARSAKLRVVEMAD